MDEIDLKNSRVLVTGGAGFIGSHIVDALLRRGARVRVLDNLSTGKRENLTAHLHPFAGLGVEVSTSSHETDEIDGLSRDRPDRRDRRLLSRDRPE